MAVKAKRNSCRIASSSTSLIARHSSTKATPLRGEKNFPVSVIPDRPRPERLNISRSSSIGSDGLAQARVFQGRAHPAPVGLAHALPHLPAVLPLNDNFHRYVLAAWPAPPRKRAAAGRAALRHAASRVPGLVEHHLIPAGRAETGERPDCPDHLDLRAVRAALRHVQRAEGLAGCRHHPMRRGADVPRRRIRQVARGNVFAEHRDIAEPGAPVQRQRGPTRHPGTGEEIHTTSPGFVNACMKGWIAPIGTFVR